MAKLFATKGAEVVVVGRRSEKGEHIVQSIISQGGEAKFIQTDMTKDDQVERLVNSTIDTYGQIDILINNDGKLLRNPSLN